MGRKKDQEKVNGKNIQKKTIVSLTIALCRKYFWSNCSILKSLPMNTLGNFQMVSL